MAAARGLKKWKWPVVGRFLAAGWPGKISRPIFSLVLDSHLVGCLWSELVNSKWLAPCGFFKRDLHSSTSSRVLIEDQWILINLWNAALFEEVVSFASCVVKVGNYWPTTLSFLIVVLSSLRDFGYLKRDSWGLWVIFKRRQLWGHLVALS